MTHQYEPHDAPDPMLRDGAVALAVLVAACLGVATVARWVFLGLASSSPALLSPPP